MKKVSNINSPKNGNPTIANIVSCLKDNNRYTHYNGAYYELLADVRKVKSYFEFRGWWFDTMRLTAKEIQLYLTDKTLYSEIEMNMERY